MIEPEKKLWEAVLLRAILDYRKKGKEHFLNRSSAKHWLFRSECHFGLSQEGEGTFS
jgi:hypothetical protein